jgi:hypothetical protein
VNEAKVGDILIQVKKTMCMHEMPQHVIRFYGNTDYALECIALKQITFVHVEKLNDPFDPVLDYVTDFNDNYATLLSHVHKHHSSQLASFKERLPEQNWKETVAGWSNLASELRAKMFVFSTCAVREGSHPRDNLYMWGHYGNGHRGVAIEFNTTALAELFIKQDAPNSESPWWKMDYKKEIPRIKCEDIIEFVMNAQPNTDNLQAYGPKLTSIILQRLHSKGKVWKSEDEWRLVWENDETKLKIYRYDIPSSAVTAVYLGCRAAEQEQLRNAFVHETQRNYPNANVCRANMRSGEYALDFEKIA